MTPRTEKEMRREAQLRAELNHQLAPGERAEFAGVIGDALLAVTDRRFAVTKIGMLGGASTEWVPLGAVAAVICSVAEGKMLAMQIAIAGRTWGDLVLSGDDLSPFNAALVRAMPARSPA